MMKQYRVYILMLCLLFQTTKNQQQYTRSQNVCGRWINGLIRCCPGWTNGLNGYCNVAICNGNCGDNGKCIAPNKCRCEDRTTREDCFESLDHEFLADEPVRCPNNCNNQGNCVNGKCACEYGFQGNACELEDIGPCFTHIRRGLCQNAITAHSNISTLITQNKCCDSVGAAWGTSCKVCGRPRCNKGFTMQEHKCVDVDECGIPGVCFGGSCKNKDGTFECACPYGYLYDSFLVKCKPVMDACQLKKNNCRPGGVCLPLPNGGYKCNCGSGFETDIEAKSCKRKQMVFNYCEIFEGQLCQYGECHPTLKSYECTCKPGYLPSRDKHQCLKEYDICAIYHNQLCGNGHCIPMGRNYRCKCDAGYVLSREGTRCLDKCQQLGNRACQNGFCLTRPYGDYVCRCKAGYEQSSDRKSCRISEIRSPSYKYSSRYGLQADQAMHEIRGKFKSLEVNKGPVSAEAMYLNPCEEQAIKRRCIGGACLNIGSGAYECQCFSGYTAVEYKTRCVRSYRPYIRNFIYKNQK